MVHIRNNNNLFILQALILNSACYGIFLAFLDLFSWFLKKKISLKVQFGNYFNK